MILSHDLNCQWLDVMNILYVIRHDVVMGILHAAPRHALFTTHVHAVYTVSLDFLREPQLSNIISALKTMAGSRSCLVTYGQKNGGEKSKRHIQNLPSSTLPPYRQTQITVSPYSQNEFAQGLSRCTSTKCFLVRVRNSYIWYQSPQCLF